MDKAYKSLCKKELHTLETLSLFESAIIYAEYHRGEGTAAAVQTKLLGHVTSQLGAPSSEISVLEELKDNLKKKPAHRRNRQSMDAQSVFQALFASSRIHDDPHR